MFSPSLLSTSDKRNLTFLRVGIVDWYAANGRKFPWRCDSASLYHRVSVEVLLQRTRAETVSSFYETFYNRFPDWQSLANAAVEDIAEIIRPIGLYNRRSVSLQALAKYAYSAGGSFPATYKELLKVPAVGQYVANAILMFEHQHQTPLLDVNMARLIERFVRPRKLTDIRYDPWLQQAAHWLVRKTPIASNWAALDFAAKVCKLPIPTCAICPVQRKCSFFRELGSI
ncbi:MAG: hypothetical protein EOO77_24120 [Oxalobacteraceae bacterium]|nr:MAG: hypothetical protein EOO77_24120 [Oxalobacteraceae bacterium]